MANIFQEQAKNKIFTTRVYYLFVFQLLLILFIIVRFFYLQVIEFENYKKKSENNRIKVVPIIPFRGNFLDRNNIKLTDNINNYSLNINPKKYAKSELESIYELLDIPQKKRTYIDKLIQKNKNQNNLKILNNLSWEDISTIQDKLYLFDNINIDDEYLRNYVFPNEFSHLIGYVSRPNDSDIKLLSAKKIPKDVYLNDNFKIGKSGLELTFNKYLLGINGYKKIEVNSNNIAIREIETINPTTAENIKLTIDSKLQEYTFNKLKDSVASVVVMNVNSGEILTMVSTPSFDSNKIINGDNDEYWSYLLTNEDKPLFNRAISSTYSAGSTFKLVVALAGLSNEDTRKKTFETYRCTGVINVLNKQFNCWEKHGHGVLSIEDAIEASCNTFFINLGTYIGNEKIYKTASKLGIGEKFDNLQLQEIKNGLLPSANWKKKTYREVWTKGDTANISIGHGFLLVTPLQLAVMVSRIANGGIPVIPYLFYNDEKTIKYNEMLVANDKRIFDLEDVNIVKNGMYKVINGKKGTASKIYFPEREKYKIAGKTGTAQVISLKTKEETDKDETLKNKFKHHGIFVGFAPFDNPKYAIAIVIEHAGSGSAVVPTAMNILKYAMDNDI